MDSESSFTSRTLSPDREDIMQSQSAGTSRKRKNEDDHEQPSKTPRIEFLNATSVDPESHWQSVAFFHEVIACAPHASAKYAALNAEQKLVLALGVRNLFLATCRSGTARETDRQILQRMMDILDEDEDLIVIGGMSMSFYPSKGYTVLKYVEDLDKKVRARRVTHFAQVMTTPRLFAVFVNPAELSYHNFENIVPLDNWLETRLEMGQHEAAESFGLELKHVQRLRDGKEVFTARLCGEGSALLKQVSDLALYVAPLNKGTRGGERFIFHSAILSDALTRAVKTSGILDTIGDGRLGDSFEFVNYVFRCNKFAPADGNFENHLDTPYYDRARNHVSKYTMLVYLSAGRNEPLLRVQDVDVNTVEEMTCIVFDQKYEHEGRPFVEGNKIFFRTELIFKDTTLRHDEKISRLFSTACYMTGQSLLDKELAAYAHTCFERANSLHWSLNRDSSSSILLLKKFQGLDFMTNGYNYWFPKRENVTIKDYAATAVLDYFNCKVGTQPFRALSKSTTVKEHFTSSADVWTYLAEQPPDKATSFRRLQKADLDSLPKKAPDGPFVGLLDEYEYDLDHLEETDLENPCCLMHTYPLFNPWKSKDVMEIYDKCCNYTLGKIRCAPIIMLGSEVLLNDDNIQVVGDKIHILQDVSRDPPPPLNFAACWCDAPMPEAFITLDKEIPAPRLLVPPILFHEFEQGFELTVDFFRNSWMVSVDGGRTVPVPVVTVRPVDEGDNPFFEKLVGSDGAEEVLEGLELEGV